MATDTDRIAGIISCPGDSLPTTVTELITVTQPTTVTELITTTAPIHKVPRGAVEPPGTPPGKGASDAGSSSLARLQTPTSCSAVSFSSPTKITGVATIILPPHQTFSPQAPSSSPTLCSPLTAPQTSLAAASLPQSPHNSPSTKPSTTSTSSSPTSSPLPETLPGCIITSQASQCHQTVAYKQTAPSSGTTVIDLNLCHTVHTDFNNNNNNNNNKNNSNNNNNNSDTTTVNKKSADITRKLTGTNITSCENNSNSLVSAFANNISIKNINPSVHHNTSINREEFEKFPSTPLKSLEEFLNTQLPFDIGKEVEREDVFPDTNDTYNQHNCKCAGGKDIASTLKFDPGNSIYSHLPAPVLPPFSSVFNEQSTLSYPSSISLYSSNPHYHHMRSDNEEEMTTTPCLSNTDTDIMVNMNPAFALTRSDSGFGTNSSYSSSSRTNSSSSYCSSNSSSMDLDCEEPWGTDLAEERNYTDLTSVRSVCPEQGQ
ncbi:hypothetical protein ElyMa_004274700 [Elysia marginata]|uniref:Uncharacterized protein n=1 Tax=Elysia marginata TaxID=1093978 RepID=A0AAV4GUX4_9GAST|nr:hypothetical protein ElyMa_004274700 [Elysia marginata]